MSYIKHAYFDSIVRNRHSYAVAVAATPAVVAAAPVAQPSTAQEKAAAKAAYHLAGGLVIRQAPDGAYLVPSGTRGGTIHRVTSAGCSCESGQHGRPCWHVEAVRQSK